MPVPEQSDAAFKPGSTQGRARDLDSLFLNIIREHAAP